MRHREVEIDIGQTQCQRLPHEWGLEKGITEAKSYPRRTHQLHQACPSGRDRHRLRRNMETKRFGSEQ
jgi:hypothetical protein